MRYDIDQRPDSPNWYIVWTERRRSKRRSTGTPDREQAELVLAAFRLEVARGPEAKQDQVGLAGVLTDYYERHAKAKPSALQAKIAIDHLTRFFGIATVAAVTPATVDDYLAHRRAEHEAKGRAPLSNDTLIRELTVLNAALRRAVKHRHIVSAPRVDKPPPAKPREKTIDRDEVARLLIACGDDLWMRNFVRLAFYTGARRNAILELQWSQVDLRHRLMTYALPSRLETNKRRATVPLAGALYTALVRARERAKGPYVIEDAGQPVTTVRWWFRKACKRAGLEGVTPITLRHSAATAMRRGNAKPWDVAGMLGHSRLSTTERYAKHDPEFLATALQATLRGGARQKRANKPGKKLARRPTKPI